MSEVLHADIFFFITGIAVIVCSAILCVALFHAIKVLISLRRIVDRIDAGTEIIAEDMQQLRSFFAQEGFIRNIIRAISGSPKRTTSRAKTERRNTELKINDESR